MSSSTKETIREKKNDEKKDAILITKREIIDETFFFSKLDPFRQGGFNSRRT